MSLIGAVAALALAALGLAFLGAPAAQASPGGLSMETASEEAPETETVEPGGTGGAGEAGEIGETAEATLVGERAIPPADAPRAVRRVIAAANRIRATPYLWGGGHARWWDRGYDCSGSVSYALHGGGLLETPLVSGSFTRWGLPGPGRWITIYANRRHVYAVIAGLRWDTVGDPRGVTGPRWHAEPPYPKGFRVRHPAGY